MAIASKDIPVSREDVAGWLAAYDHSVPIYDYIQSKIDALNLPDTEVDTGPRYGQPGTTTPLVDLIVADLGSYGYSG